MKRRSFIKKAAGIFAGSLLIPSIISEKIYSKSLPVKPNFKPAPSTWKSDELNLAWIGHSTVLINFYGTIILTDPVLFERVGIYFLGMTLGPARYSAPALELDEIPKPDLILLSHAHMDHTDYKTLLNITDKYPGEIDCITAYNTIDVTNELEWRSIKEMDWKEETVIHGIKIKAIEVKHFGWRYPWERDRSRGYFHNGRSYNAYLLEKNGKKILFGGDTAYSEKFRESDIENIDISIMPIGAYDPWKTNHCNPEEALIMASHHLKAKIFIPVHCLTFRQGREPIDEPVTWLTKSAMHYKTEIGLKYIGESFRLGA